MSETKEMPLVNIQHHDLLKQLIQGLNTKNRHIRNRYKQVLRGTLDELTLAAAGRTDGRSEGQNILKNSLQTKKQCVL